MEKAVKEISLLLIVAIIAAAVLAVVSVPISDEVYAASVFSDMSEKHWAYDAVRQLTKEKITEGYPDGSFKPEKTVTYGEFIKLVYAGCSGKTIENSANGKHWAENYYYAAAADGYLEFRHIDIAFLSEPIPRKHMAYIASKVVDAADGKTNLQSQELVTDITAVSEYSYDIMKACAAGVLTGYDDGSFKPDKTLTRAEAAVVITRLRDYMNEYETHVNEENVSCENENIFDDAAADEVIVRKTETGVGTVSVSYSIKECKMLDMGIEKFEYGNDGTLKIYSNIEYPFVFVLNGDGTILDPIGFPGGFAVYEDGYYIYMADTGVNIDIGEKMYFMFEDGREVYRFSDIKL